MATDKQKGFINKNILMALAGMVILLLALVVFWEKPKTDQPQSGNQNKSAGIIKKDLAADEVSARFPAEVPIEQGAQITQNYEADTPDGTHQATRVFESAKTVAQNYKIYFNFFTAMGWNVANKLEKEDSAFLMGRKGETLLLVTISKNSITGAVSVDLTAVSR